MKHHKNATPIPGLNARFGTHATQNPEEYSESFDCLCVCVCIGIKFVFQVLTCHVCS